MYYTCIYDFYIHIITLLDSANYYNLKSSTMIKINEKYNNKSIFKWSKVYHTKTLSEQNKKSYV
jgi:hypothetical protein